jgi:hypothetical protein
MKTLFVGAVAIAAMIGTPAGAQEYFQSKLLVNPSARQPPINRRGPVRYSTNPTHDVYDTNGEYVGSDPDPQVRTMLNADDALGKQ